MNGYQPLETLIADQLAEERGRRQAVEARGLAVITSSGTMVTLLFAVTGLVTSGGGVRIQGASKVLVASAAVAFSLAALLAIFIQKPLLYQEPRVRWLRGLTWPAVWDDVSPSTAARRAAEARVNSIESFRNKNRQKIRLLTAALSCEAVAIAFVVAAVIALFT